MPKIIKPAKGTFTAASITVDSSGRIITASSGSAGVAGNLVMTHFAAGSGNVDTFSGATKMVGYLTGGGGGAGNDGNSREGGAGGRAVFEVDVTHPQSIAYATGNSGVATGTQGGNDGNDSTFGSPALVTCEGGERGLFNQTGQTGNVSFAASGVTPIADSGPGTGTIGVESSPGPVGGGLVGTNLLGGRGGLGKSSGNTDGNGGFLIVFQNIGT